MKDEPDVIKELRSIVDKKQYNKVKDPKTGKQMKVDLYSASAVIRIYDGLKNPTNKKKFVDLGLKEMVNVSFKLLNKLKENINEKYNYKKDALNAFFKGKISVDELIKIGKNDFGSDVATKSELDGFLKNKFMQDVMADTYGISTSVLVKKVKELQQKIK